MFLSLFLPFRIGFDGRSPKPYIKIQGQGLAGPRKGVGLSRKRESTFPFFGVLGTAVDSRVVSAFPASLPLLCCERLRGPLLLCEGLGGMDGEREMNGWEERRREGREGGGGWMKADETEKDWKRRCFNEQQLPICSGSLPGTYTAGTLQYYTGAPWARLRSGSGRVRVGECGK